MPSSWGLLIVFLVTPSFQRLWLDNRQTSPRMQFWGNCRMDWLITTLPSNRSCRAGRFYLPALALTGAVRQCQRLARPDHVERCGRPLLVELCQ